MNKENEINLIVGQIIDDARNNWSSHEEENDGRTNYISQICLLKDGWVDAKDKLPQNWERVLVYNGTNIHLATFKLNKFIYPFDNQVTHWMSLPEPPSN